MEENKNQLVEEWWSEWQVETATDVSRVWELKTFKNVPGFWTIHDGHRLLGRLSDHSELPPGAIIDNDAWNHEHCELCHETISEYPDYQHEGYFDGKEWICIECYKKYILPRL